MTSDLTEKKDSLCIYQARINPPHFKVIIDENIRNLKPVGIWYNFDTLNK